MKGLVLFFTTILVSTFSIGASETATETLGNTAYTSGYGDSFIFVEDDITFSVFPDGEFDFFLNNTPYGGSHVNIGFNAGYDYSGYLQYDDYGAVIQIMNTPVFYDHYGRVAQIGSVRIFYNNRRVVRIGGLHIFYNPYGVYSHCNGYINVYNRVYVYRPFHRFFVRPVVQFCMVSFKPYRQYYAPIRYSYYKPYRNNARKCYATVGAPYYYKQNHSRNAIYKNDKRVSRRDYNTYAGRASRRDVAKSYQEASKNDYPTIQSDAKRPYAKTAKKRKDVNTPAKSYKRSSGKVSRSRNDVKHRAPAKRDSRKSQYKATPERSTKAVKRSSQNKRESNSKTRGRNTRSRT